MPHSSSLLNKPSTWPNDHQIEFAKWLAVATMVIDHFGALFHPDIAIFRMVGRCSFPLFLWVLSLRLAEDTRRAEGYLLRLAFWGLISQLPFGLVFSYSTTPQDQAHFWLIFSLLNIMVTFFLGVWLTIISIDLADSTASLKHKAFLWGNAFLILLLATRCDYGVFGVLAMPLLVYIAQRGFIIQTAIVAGLMAGLANFTILYSLPEARTAFAVCAMIGGGTLAYRCLFTRAKPWRMAGWFFYAFYPVHICILYILRVL